jgi:hypothetical protein
MTPEGGNETCANPVMLPHIEISTIANAANPNLPLIASITPRLQTTRLSDHQMLFDRRANASAALATLPLLPFFVRILVWH